MNLPKLQCLTLDGIALSHVAQVRELCRAGAEWIQLRMKDAADAEVEAVARECLALCRRADCRFVVNDHIEVALRVGADGVHLGKFDTPWAEAREMAGGGFLIGGTVNSLTDAEAAVAAGVLDYVGVGPFRYTGTKKNLAPVLTDTDWAGILNALDGLPSYAIGGICCDDFERIGALGVTGAAVCSLLYRDLDVSNTYQDLAAAWKGEVRD